MTTWTERDAAVVWHGFTQMACYADNAPLIIERGEGRELIDVDGKRYLDAISSLWVTTLGHRVPELDAALIEQAARIAHSTLLGNGNRIVIEFAEALAKVVPVERPHFLFASDGACAVEQALKIAFQYWTNQNITNRTRYLAFGDGYHGDTVGSLSLGGSGFGTGIFDPLRFDVLRAPSFRDASALSIAAQMVRENASQLAAVVVEPLVQGAAGMFIAAAASFKELADTCAQTGVLLVCDEVATGFGRTGALFASELCGLKPDILCLGKGITGGYLPMSATAASQKVYAAFLGADHSDRTFYHGHSYGGNALAAAVALRHLQLLADGSVLANVRARSEQLATALNQLKASAAIKAIRLCGLMGAVELHDANCERLLARRVCAAMVRRGVLSRSMGNVVTLVPPLTVTALEIERIVTALSESLIEITA